MTKEAIKKLNKAKTIEQLEIERFSPDKKTGLTNEQVQGYLDSGLVNVDTSNKSKSIAQIIFSKIFTFFNLLYLVITIILLIEGLWKQCGYIFVVLTNTTIAIVQEIKSKRTLDKLKLITQPQIKVIRNGEEMEISVDQLVLDDIVLLSNGSQISADCEIIDGFVETNEAILTGESDAITKNVGDTLFAGSFIVSGSCIAKVKAVGKFNYIAGLTGRAKQYQKPRSQMLKALNKILVFVAIIIVPMAICLYLVNAEAVNMMMANGETVLPNPISLTAGSVISMIPASPFLLTSIALAVSFLRLAKHNTMVQELYCIEMLARVDTLCLDKTGTITDGTMQVVESIDLRPNSTSSYTIREIISSMNTALKADNMTSKALKKYFGSPRNPSLSSVSIVPFSSQRKLSAVSFKGEGTYFLGAPEYVLKTQNQRVTDMVKKYAEQGLRVLLLAHSTTTMTKDSQTLPQVRRPVAVIVIEDHIRVDAEETIKWFKSNGVAIKIISGDNPSAVANIATRVGVENAESYISLEGMTEEQVRECATKYTVFGRVSPDQKAILVKAMRANGSTVAMTGDGVNDILAMKEADCSISLAGGSDAARQVSHLILMDDSFSSLPKVVGEGRRVVNNIQKATSMYYMRTLFVIALNVVLVCMHFFAGKTMASPLINSQVMLMDLIVIGLPTTLLALQSNESPIKGRFLPNVLKRCLPASFTFFITTISFYILQNVDATLVPSEMLSTMVAMTYTFGGLYALFVACKPFNKWKIVMYSIVWILTLVAILVPSLNQDLFEYAVLGKEQVLLLLVEIFAMPYILFLFIKLFNIPQKDNTKKTDNIQK